MRGNHRAGAPVIVWITAVTLAVVLAAGSCSSGEPTPPAGAGAGGTLPAKLIEEDPGPPTPGGKISFGLSAESEGFSPVTSTWAGSTYVVGLSIMDPLAAYDTALEARPYLAEDIRSNAEFTEWTIRLRAGVTLSDGSPLDAALVRDNLEAQRTSFLTAPSLALVQAGNGITAADERTVVVRTSKPWSTFPHLLTAQVGIIGSRATLTAAGADKPVGSGPFILSEWVRGRSLVVRKNPNYWRKGYPLLDEIEFKAISDTTARGAAFDTDGVQIFETGDAPQILAMTDRAKQKQVQLLTDAEANSAKVLLGLNVTKAPFDDPVARRALATAIDSPGLSSSLFGGVYPPARSVFNTGSRGFVEPEAYPRFDTVAAKKLADEYQQKHGRPIEFALTSPPEPEVRRIAAVLQQYLKDAGITMTLKDADPITLAGEAFFGSYQATVFILFGSPHLDREYVFLASPAQKDGLSLNFTRVGVNADGTRNGDNDRVVAAMDEARRTIDRDAQDRQYAIVQQEMAKNLGFVFLVAQRAAIVFATDVHGPGLARLPDATGADGGAMRPDGSFTYNLWRRR